MEFRAGKCSQCGAEYQIPASFAHNVARCKKCKVGVVHVSATARGAGGAAASAPPVQARPAATAPEPARAAAPPTTGISGRREEEPDRRGEALTTRARPPSVAPKPTGGSGPSEEPPGPARAVGASERANGRSPRAAVVGVGLLLLAAVFCAWFFYFRT